MTLQIALFLVAGLFGGIVNAAAGGAKLFVFPMLLAAGLPPLVANATGTAGVWPSQLAAIWVFREHLRDNIRGLIGQMLPALAGAFCGALALIWSSEAAFLAVIPVLLIIAVGAILLGNRLAEIAQRLFPGDRLKPVTGFLLFASGVYGGYFGAGYGFILLAVLSVTGLGLRQANASKNLFAFCMNTIAVIPLSFSGLIDWVAAGSVLTGSLIGGYFGARLSQAVPEKYLRAGVAGVGVILTASFLLR
ncbi:putative permease [Hoeflea sp. IMCC20628]|uniref:sulfite exporter TauE/SafE family protein n=1 Tax=Hoeflea sp. IMCC20628 TaxID=1620421 RepID=UPI00063AF599|nr:sulfite exporter TauE/SafE family protein [Hoeflea sp. IMCC20628]AKH98881.1 putative permease [Hoeflea sp. IMCC20628]